MKRNKRIIVLLCLMTIMLLAGCTEKPVSEAQLQSDLSAQVLFVNSVNISDVSISNLEIEKRQTTADEKIDRVWVQVDVENNDAEGKLYYLMVYGLYNDGWRLDNVEIDRRNEWFFTPLRGPAEDMVSDLIPIEADISNEELDLEAGTMNIRYTCNESFNCCDVSYERGLQFVFSPGAGLWSVGEQYEISKTEHWNVDGNWQYKKVNDDNGVGIVLYIENFDPANMNTVNGGFAIASWNKYMLSSTWEDGTPVYGPFAIEEPSESSNSKYKYLIHTNKNRASFGGEYYIKVSYDNIAVGGKSDSESYWLLLRDN